MSEVTRAFGREAFGAEAANYDAARPAYPDWVFDLLCERCGLGPGAAVFEIGAGTGTASRRLLALGADPLVAVEPDGRMAAVLSRGASRALHIIEAPFETADFPRSGFDLGVCPTAFHWLDEDEALAKIAELLRPGGWWAAVWNLFGDPVRDDPFHEATARLLEAPPPPSIGSGPTWFPLDARARFAALERAGRFDTFDHVVRPWSLRLDPDQVVALYATYSTIAVRADRAEVLAELRRIAQTEFPAGVVRNMLTSVFIARRR